MPPLTFPVETIKPFVFLNVSNATFLITQSLCAVISEEWKDYKDDSENFLSFIERKSEIQRILYLLGFLLNLPAKLLNEFFSSRSDISWEVDGINAL